VYFPCWFLKMALIISHRHYLHVAFVSILVFQTFDRMMFGIFNFLGAKLYVLTVWVPQMVRDEKKFGNHCFRQSVFSVTWFWIFASGNNERRCNTTCDHRRTGKIFYRGEGRKMHSEINNFPEINFFGLIRMGPETFVNLFYTVEFVYNGMVVFWIPDLSWQ